MKNDLTFKGVRVSPLTLGGAQLGLDYGIANRTGRPNARAARELMKKTMRAGVTTFDTAPDYGDSEAVIGEFIAHHHLPPPTIVTKIPRIDFGAKPSFKRVYETMRASLTASARRLHLDAIPVCLLHHAPDMTAHDGLAVKALRRLKREGLTRLIGVSVYRPQEVDTSLGVRGLDVIQVPLNVFDQRLVNGGQLRELKRRRKLVFARSIFLQGLFFLDPANLPSHLHHAQQPLRRLRQIAEQNGRSVAELALVFVRDLPGVASLVLGMETAEQLAANIKLMKAPPLSDELGKELATVFRRLPEKLLNPARWRA